MKTDAELVKLCQRRDAHAWQTLIERHQRWTFNLAYQFAGEYEAARDLAQDIFVRVYESLDSYDGSKTFKTWFVSIARNLCIDDYRKRKRRQALEPITKADLPGPYATEEPADVRIEKEERSEVLLAALEQLGSISRDTIVLRDFQGMSHEEMAALDGVAIGTVKSRISRARTDLARAVLKLERGEKRQVRHGMS
ncbi:MAG: RNA polymerase sigma factor [Candidatus Eisenbacteria bacterium]|uniref:RNA polymerase sigma factor n=1 Tax=Eiseniibacteriota bacterium TaxID=2212470 RepID=A0A956NDW7_UNCEI|nr:RNA polymerase sigma factor [Candidatus Eisenbacteria bacterium]MCB9465448.1 RNA polymerase sigma factor [Candidatus Eisenbacteria bacterium]